MKEKKKIKTATWTAVKNPLYLIDCPHCGKTIFMGKPSLIEKMVKWAEERIKK